MNIRQIPYFLGPLIFVLALIWPSESLTHSELAVLGILGWMLTWWITEIVNLAVTALLPILLLPLTGILPIADVTALYGHHLIFLFFGGFILALAIEKWKLHRRIALLIIRMVGSSPRRILLGFMIATAFLSAWISNTATTVMMLPMAMSVLQLLKKAGFQERKVSIAILMGVAWSANIGGMTTLIGTPPNLVFTGFYSQNYSTEITFAEWLKIGLPVAISLFIAAYALLSLMVRKIEADVPSIKSYFAKEYEKLGKLEGAEMRVAIVFGLTALLWIIRPQLVDLLGLVGFTDTSVAILASIALFVIPASRKEPLLVWKDTKNLAWGILILFGGGLALASGMNESGLLRHITDLFAAQSSLGLLTWIFFMAVLGIWATEIMSNMALVAAMMPIVAAIAGATGESFFLLALPLTLGSSCAFMLPMATPPNAIVFSSGELRIVDMVRRGFFMNLIATLLITLIVFAVSDFLP
ncbi:MAG: SLC13/DASS family transporter [Flavobacteriia bacterium]|nr:SLC13/DASS family transporter [Flavobacteriia bacterium]